MPLVDGAGGNPYPTINEVMDIARARVNDMMNDTTGDLLSNDSPASQTYLTAAWKWYQARCDTAGVQTFKKTIPIYGIPARSTNDVMNECWITWAGCSDGVNGFDGPVLPQDMISPKSIWQRPSQPGNPLNNSSGLQLMTQATDGLPPYLDCNVYEWREDGMYFYGTSYAQDWKFSYSAYRLPLDITKPDFQVPMMMCEECLGYRVALEFTFARGGIQRTELKAMSEEAFSTISQRATRIKGRQNIRRQGYSGGGSNRTYPNFLINP